MADKFAWQNDEMSITGDAVPSWTVYVERKQTGACLLEADALDYRIRLIQSGTDADDIEVRPPP